MLFVASKVLWAAFRPDNLLLALIIAGVVLSWTRRRRRAGRWLAALGLAGMVGIAVAPVDALLFAPLEDRFPPMRDPPAHVDGIIVLGGAVDALQSQRKGMPSLNDEAERITTMVELARRYPDAKLVFTSGSPSIFGGPSEADATEPLLAGLGLDTSKIIFERKSRNTYENAIYSKPLADPKPGETWLLVTSAWHMPRSVGVFRRAGWPVLPWPVAYRTGREYELALGLHLREFDRAVHEWSGLVAYRLLGRTDAIFPAPEARGQP